MNMLDKNDLISPLIYALITMVFFLPVVLNPSGVFLGHLGGDVGIITFVGNEYVDRAGDVMTYNLNAPFGGSLTNLGTYQPVFVFILPFFSKIFGVLATYNYYLIFNIWFASATTYLFARMFLRSKHAAFISGLIFGFSPYMIGRAIAFHVNLVSTGWMIIFFASLFNMEKKKTVLSGIMCGMALFFVGFTSYYNLYFSCIFTVIFYIWHWKKGTLRWFKWIQEETKILIR